MKKEEKNKKKIKIIIVSIIIAVVLWFLVVSPIIEFKRNEKIVKEAAERYYEINSGQLPTGEKVKTISLQTLYEKDFINEDLRSPYSRKVCDSRNSWTKVKKENGEYKYYVYLKCGMFSSKVDHKGPEIKLKGEEEVTINKGEEYKDPGIESVVDATDGKINIKDVQIDNTKVNTNKIGNYEITYKVKDSFNNETVKVRRIKVIETLNHIVEKSTGKNKVYKGSQYNNYVKLDGILFKIVGENEDGSVKIVTEENIAAVNYDGIETWLNEYFYGKLSESAKKLIVKSKWCNEKVSNPEGYTKCNSYGKKNNVGLLSVADINNSKDEDGNSNIDSLTSMLLGNKDNSNRVIALESGKYKTYNLNENIGIRPTINILEDTKVISGTGTSTKPYILKGNRKTLKVGENISEARVGEYISYSGYKWRVIGKEEDGTTKVIMNDILQNSVLPYNEDGKSSLYSIDKKTNIGYKVNNTLTKYINSKYFVKKNINVKVYKQKVGYNLDYTNKKYKTKLILPSIYDIFSASNSYDFWFIDYSKTGKENYQYLRVYGVVHQKKDTVSEAGVRLIGYLDDNIRVKKGAGTIIDSYTIVK